MKLAIYNQGLKLLIRGSITIFFSIIILLIQGCSKMPTPDLQNLKLPTSSNYYLVCPKNFCNVEPNEYSPVYNVSAEDLFYAWNQLTAKELYMNITGTIPEKAQYEYVQRSPVFGFPDDITIQFIAISNYSSTLAIYSRSRYGIYDFDVNKKRVKKFLIQLSNIIANLQPSNSTPAANNDEEVNANVKNLNSLVIPNIPSSDNSNATNGASTDNASGTTTNTSGATANNTTTDSSGTIPNTTTDNINGTMSNTNTDNMSS